jgi:hypothetical protein
MIKICANVAKKVPLPGVEYSSQQFGAAMEIEVSDADPPELVQQRLKDLYNLLTASIDKQIGNAADAAKPERGYEFPQNGCKECQSMHPTKGQRKVSATPAQQRALLAICRTLGIDFATVLLDHNISNIGELSIKDASRLIDELKSRQGGGNDFDHST